MQITPELIKRYHQGQCTPTEQQAVERWLGGEDVEQVHNYIHPEQRAELRKKIWNGLPGKDANTSLAKQPWKIGYAWASGIAASLLLAAIFIFFSNKVFHDQKPEAGQSTSYTVIKARNGEKKRFYLPDSSLVYLNAGSEIKFPGRFTDTSRAIYLTGEAYFQVTKDADRPFTVSTAHTKTRVLGTAFDLKAYPNENTLVSVTEGLVRFSDLKGGQHEILPAGNSASYNLYRGHLERRRVFAATQAAWVHNRMIFKDNSLREVSKTIERWYGVRLTVKRQKLQEVIYTGSFENASLTMVLDDMAAVMKFNYAQRDNQVIIN